MSKFILFLYELSGEGAYKILLFPNVFKQIQQLLYVFFIRKVHIHLSLNSHQKKTFEIEAKTREEIAILATHIDH